MNESIQIISGHARDLSVNPTGGSRRFSFFGRIFRSQIIVYPHAKKSYLHYINENYFLTKTTNNQANPSPYENRDEFSDPPRNPPTVPEWELMNGC